MEFVTIEDRVDRLEALFGQFITEMAVINKRAEERNKAAEERHEAAEERMTRFEQEMRADRKALNQEMQAFYAEMRADHMALSQEMHKDREALSQEMQAFKEEMRADRKAMNKQWGDLANKLGTIIEDIVAPNLRRLATEYFGFAEVRECMIRWNRKKPNAPSAWEEFDVVVAGPEAVIVGEAKSSMNIEAAGEFAEKLKGFSEFAPHLASRRVIPVVGCWSIPPKVIDRLSELGIYAMCMGEETMEIVNGESVRTAESGG